VAGAEHELCHRTGIPAWRTLRLPRQFLLSRGEGYHEYDNAQSQFLAAYTHTNRVGSRDEGRFGALMNHSFRFSFGAQQQTFYSFAGGSKSTILPVIHFTLF
jgi:hypothetical protein